MTTIGTRRLFRGWMPGLALLAIAACRTQYNSVPLDEAGILTKLDTFAPSPSTRAGRIPDELFVTLEEAQLITIYQHPALWHLRASRGLATAADLWADERPNPKLTITPLWAIPDSVLAGVASLQWELLPNGVRDARRGLAASLRNLTDATVAGAEWSFASATRIAWLEYAYSLREVETARDALMLANELLLFIQKREENTMATRAELDMARADLAVAKSNFHAAGAASKDCEQRLAVAMGLPPYCIITLNGAPGPLQELKPRIPAGDEDFLLLSRLPGLAEKRARYEMAERELELACRDAGSSVGMGPAAERDSTTTYLGASVEITIPLRSRPMSEIYKKRTEREMAALGFAQELAAARANVMMARTQMNSAKRALDEYNFEVLPMARRAFETIQLAVDQGSSDLSQYFLARERLQKAATEQSRREAAHALAVARLEIAFGPDRQPAN